MIEQIQELDEKTLRKKIELANSNQDWKEVYLLLCTYWRLFPGTLSSSYLLQQFLKLKDNYEFIPFKIGIVRSFTLEPIVPLLQVLGFVGGLHLSITLGEFDNYSQEIINPNSWLSLDKPDVTILAIDVRDRAPALWNNFTDLSVAEINEHKNELIRHVEELIYTFRKHHQKPLLIHSFVPPQIPSKGILDILSHPSQKEIFTQINQEIAAIAKKQKDIYLLDLQGLVASRGSFQFEDLQKWVMARLPIRSTEMLSLAKEWMKYIHPLSGRVCKCLVVDLDNTMWGGVIGEDGFNGIKLDATDSGFAWSSLQRAVLDLYNRGIILAVASKNNHQDAMEVIDKHPGMLLRGDKFAAFRINWNDKATSLREIAAELNIGINALAFLDDNPIEREWVRSQLPEVTVIELPSDPLQYASTLRSVPQFERLTLTEEDADRGRMYVEQRMRSELQSAASSLEDFYRSLEIQVQINRVDESSLARVAQLTQKTNQFNLTTKRYTEQQILTLSQDKNSQVWAIRARDKFGDNGIVGVIITKDQKDTVEIDTFLLSCRVIGRTIETALAAHIAQDALRRGFSIVEGSFIPTSKNAPASNFFADHNFQQIAATPEKIHWKIDLSQVKIECPEWINIISEA